MENKSYWTKDVHFKKYPQLTNNEECDFVIVGGGITGITTALLLAIEGHKIILLESNRIGMGTTSKTTGKVTYQHGLIYSDIVKYIGLETAKSYYKANTIGLMKIKELIKSYSIDCDYQETSSYLYSVDKKETKKIQKEKEIYDTIGIDSELVYSTALPFSIDTALKIDDQVIFHPLKYIKGLLNELDQFDNVTIYEQSKVIDINEKKEVYVKTNKNSITCQKVLLATNYPIGKFSGNMFIKMHQERSYIITKQVDFDINGMYINTDKPVHSYRMHDNNLFIGGYSHQTGKKSSDGYNKLKQLMHNEFEITNNNEFQFSTQDSMSLDNMPYIGPISENVFVSCGYNKWGMTSSMIGALIINDYVTNKNEIDKDIKKIFLPNRLNLVFSIKNLLKHSITTINAYTLGNLLVTYQKEICVEEGCGKIVRNGLGLFAVSKVNGLIYAFDAHCTHLGCPLKYNELEHTFDCPCHGSRYSLKGDVLKSPAVDNLKNK